MCRIFSVKCHFGEIELSHGEEACHRLTIENKIQCLCSWLPPLCSQIAMASLIHLALWSVSCPTTFTPFQSMADLFCCSFAAFLLVRANLNVSFELMHLKYKVDYEEVNECVYQIPCKNCDKVCGRDSQELMDQGKWAQKEVESKDTLFFCALFLSSFSFCCYWIFLVNKDIQSDPTSHWRFRKWTCRHLFTSSFLFSFKFRFKSIK